jgi:L-fuconolactonase
MLIDAHHHLWRYSASEYPWIDEHMEVLRRDFHVEELSQLAHSAGVDGFVSVQARQSVLETEALLDVASQCGHVVGVVGWIPLANDDVVQHLDRLTRSPWLKGVRHVVQDEPDDRFLLGEAFNRGVAALKSYNLVYDLLIYARQLPAAIEFIDAHPSQLMVVDHIAKPSIERSKFHTDWERDFRELAKREHVCCKVSGVVTEISDSVSRRESHKSGDWSVDDIRRYWDVALEAFTPKRLMFGSDWPVCLLRTSYDRWLATVRELAVTLSPGERADLFAATAVSVYKLEVD